MKRGSVEIIIQGKASEASVILNHKVFNIERCSMITE